MLERSRLEQELWELGITGARKISLGSGESGPKPILLKHYHVRKRLDTRKGKLVPDPKADVMNPLRMDPGFVDAKDKRRKALQKDLMNLLNKKYKDEILSKPGAAPDPDLKIALVDLTEKKQHTPIFAGYYQNSSVEGDNITSILPLYAAFQLRFDLNTFARLNKITESSKLEKLILDEWSNAGLISGSAPKLKTLFQFKDKASGVETTFLNPPVADWAGVFANKLVRALGFDYIGSVALQSGLFDEKRGGLWLNAAYFPPPDPWSNSPFPSEEPHSASALAAARFFVLLAQGRLVNEVASKGIATALKPQCISSYSMIDGIKGLKGVIMKSPNICAMSAGRGVDYKGPDYNNEAIHMVRQRTGGKHLSYVAVALAGNDARFRLLDLGKDLDLLIAAQNP